VSPPRGLGRDTSATLSVQHRSAPNALLLLLRSSSYKFEFYISESGPWTEEKLRYLTMRYITYPIVVATIGAKGLPQSLIVSLRKCSCSSTSLSRSMYVRHIGYFVVHDAQRSKAANRLGKDKATLDACTWELWLGFQTLEQGHCPGYGDAVT
jgi:hypothetical protein